MIKKIAKEEITVPADINSLKDLRGFINRIGKKYRISGKAINSFRLAVDEASTNIIRHAYRDRSGDIKIRAVIRKDSMVISLIDQGRFFDPNQLKDPDLKRYVAIGKKGGLGIFMIRRLVDDIKYYHTQEGNELRLIKTKDVRRKSRFTIPKLPGSMQVKYFAYSALFITIVFLGIYIYKFNHIDDRIIQDTSEQMQSISSVFAQNSIEGLLEDDALSLSKTANVIVEQNPKFVKMAVITDSDNFVKGTTKPKLFPLWQPFDSGDTVRTLQNGTKIVQISHSNPDSMKNETEYFLVQNKVMSNPGNREKRTLGRVYLYFLAEPVFSRISSARISDLKLYLSIWAFANIGVGLLLFLVFTPLQKLATWVRDMGQEDIRDKMDIDTSSEIGKIAEAFGDISDKFRESQRSLADKERMQQEMHLAREIQQTLLPPEFPKIKGYEIASHYEAAKEVGGDYYDFVEVDRDRMGIVVADVSGKGVPGSLVMTMIRTALRTEAKETDSASEVLAKVNNFVLDDIKKGMFVTLFYTILDSRKRRVTFSSAGHNPMILYRHSTQKTYYLNPKGFPIGISLNEGGLFKQYIEDDTIQLSKGDIILCYTDGITEAMNSKRELFGEERLLEVLREHGHLRAKQFVEKLKEELTSFTEGQIQNDDITFVVIKENMNQEESEFERARKIYYDMLNNKSMTEACNAHGLPVSTFAQKYRKKLEKYGVNEFKKEFEQTSVEAKHLSIEEQTKIYDIIRKHPSWGAKRISNQLDTEEYGYTKINENRIYAELVRKRLNTRSLREGYVSRSSNKKRMKPPGTPLLTLDGKVIKDEQLGPKLHAPIDFDEPTTHKRPDDDKEKDKRPERKPGDGKHKTEKLEEEVQPKDSQEADIILSNIVDLLDKNKQLWEKQKEDTTKQEDVSKEELQDEPDSEKAMNEEEENDQVEYDSNIQELLSNIDDEGQDEREQEESEEIDFTDLSASEYAQEFFDNRSNGDENQDELEEDDKELALEEKEDDSEGEDQVSEPIEKVLSEEDDRGSDEDVSEEQKQEINPEKILENLSIEKSEDATSDSNMDDFEDIISEVREFDSLEEVEEKPNLEDLRQDSDEESDEEEKEIFELIAGEGLNLQEEIVNDRDEAKEESLEQGKPASKSVGKRKEDNLQKLLVAGGHFYMQRKYDKAVNIFHRIINKYPDNIEAYYNLGNAYFRMSKLDDAQKAYEKVCELDPTFLDAMENLGVIFANKKEYEKAIEIWKKILEFDPKRVDIKKNIEKALRINKK